MNVNGVACITPNPKHAISLHFYLVSVRVDFFLQWIHSTITKLWLMHMDFS